jgi:hypothetical protein
MTKLQRLLSLTAFTSALTLTLASQDAHAYDMSGRFGIGGQRTLTGYTGMKGRYFFNSRMSADLTLGMSVFKPDEDDVDSTIDTSLTPGFNYWIIPSGQAGALQAQLGVGGRVGFYIGKRDGDVDLFEIDVEVPVIAELFFGPHFSLAPEVGLVLRFPVGDGGYDEVDKGFGFEFGQNTGLFGAGSFNFYF